MSRLGVALLFAAAGCTDFATPAQLATPQLIAVVAEPPVVRPGQTSALTAVVAGPDGVVTGLTPRWSLVESFPTVPPMGTVSADGDGARYAAPAEVPERPEGVPPIDTVRLEVDVTVDGAPRTLAALKVMGVVDVDAENPTIRVVDAAGAEVTALTAAVDAPLALAIEPDPAPTEDARFAWYATVGEIEAYQSNPTELTAAEPGAGTVIVVYRDGAGGVAWRELPITVE
ncbi:MAG: hypothetical protein R2939_05100 [Kofleriaceae bacterium]